MFENQAIQIGVVIISVLLSMTFHEAMHAYMSYWLGDDTAQEHGRLTLNPLKHIDPFLTLGLPVLLTIAGAPVFGAAKPVPFNPHRIKWGEFGAALVGVIGPLTNLALAFLAAAVLNLGDVSLGSYAGGFLQTFILVNLGFFVFNMIPFPPLDGSRLLYAFAPEPLQNIMAKIERLGIMGIVIFMFVLFPLVSPVMANVIESIFYFLV